MYNSHNWERWVNRELLQQLAAKDKIELPKGEATERYVRTFAPAEFSTSWISLNVHIALQSSPASPRKSFAACLCWLMQDRNFHMTHGRIILPHDHGLLHDAECRIRNARNVRKNTDRNVLKVTTHLCNEHCYVQSMHECHSRCASWPLTI